MSKTVLLSVLLGYTFVLIFITLLITCIAISQTITDNLSLKLFSHSYFIPPIAMRSVI
ncbi:MAG: hypothetical protein ABGX03_06175 [Methylophilaceae bacterium]